MYEEIHIIKYSETDYTGNLSMQGLLRIFQDIGYSHAVKQGFGVDYSRDFGCTWYLLSWDIKAIDMPHLGDEVRVCTFFYDIHGAMAKKCVLMYDSLGKCIAAADTMWAHVSIQTGQPCEPQRKIDDGDFGEKSPCIDEKPRRIAKIRAYEKGIEMLPQKLISRYLIDTNAHANTARLTEFAMQLAGYEVDCRCLRAEFKRQVKQAATVYPVMLRTEKETLLALKDEDGVDYSVFSFS